MNKKFLINKCLVFMVMFFLAGVVHAAQPASCKTVRFATVGWADIFATTALASVVLEGLGYDPTQQLASVPVAFVGLKKDDVDVFLGNWMPSQESTIEPFLEEGSVEIVRANLEGAKFTLAVPRYVSEGGLKSFQDLAQYKDKLNGKIYGIESGSDGNRHIREAMEDLNLEDFQLIPSSEAGMLTQVGRAIRRDEWIVFLGWEPHPMNTRFDMAYLKGGDQWFGPNYGGAIVNTVVREGYLEECPNVAGFLKNLEFSLKMENQIMAAMKEGQEAEEAAADWLTEYPEILEDWLAGVTTFKGDEALPAVKDYLNL